MSHLQKQAFLSYRNGVPFLGVTDWLGGNPLAELSQSDVKKGDRVPGEWGVGNGEWGME